MMHDLRCIRDDPNPDRLRVLSGVSSTQRGVSVDYQPFCRTKLAQVVLTTDALLLDNVDDTTIDTW